MPAPSFASLVAAADRAAIAAFGDRDEDGEPVPVTYRPTIEGAVTVTGIFDEQYELAKGDAEAGVGVLGPAVFLRLEDLPVNPEDDEPTLEIRGREYRVTERRPDGMGGVVLGLRSLT